MDTLKHNRARYQAPLAASCPTCCPPGFASLPPANYGPCLDPEALQYMSRDEFVCNGDDQNSLVQVKSDWSLQGLHSGDTVVHFDTLDGRTLVTPSNEVCLYAPRFAAVRKVDGLIAHEQHDRVAGLDVPTTPTLSSEIGVATTTLQRLQPGRRHSIVGSQRFRDTVSGLGIDNAQKAGQTEDGFLPFEDFLIVRRGVFDNSEKARLNEWLQAAVTWSSGQAPQVLIDHRAAVEAKGNNQAESVYTYVVPPGKSRVRIVKIASKQNAQPGDLVEFTLRFDNVGDQPIGNVTVIDKLHDRLEYVADSQKCSLKADFVTEDFDGSPSVLKWEVTAPMKVGDGGLIRFTCRVR